MPISIHIALKFQICFSKTNHVKETLVGLLDDPLGIKKSKRKPISTKNRIRIAKGYDNKCAKCGRKLTRDNFQVDHKRSNPSSRDISDLQPLCIKCHREKTKKEAQKRAKKRKQSLLDNPFKNL